MNVTYIYTLSCPISGNIRYLGKSNNPKKRYYLHLVEKEKSKKNNWIKGLTKQGLKPLLEVIDIVPVNEWEFWEVYWINQLRSWEFDLCNLSIGGLPSVYGAKGKFGGLHHQSKKVVQYSKNGEVIKVWDSMSDASRKLILQLSRISDCCNGKAISAGKFLWGFDGGVVPKYRKRKSKYNP